LIRGRSPDEPNLKTHTQVRPSVAMAAPVYTESGRQILALSTAPGIDQDRIRFLVLQLEIDMANLQAEKDLQEADTQRRTNLLVAKMDKFAPEEHEPESVGYAERIRAFGDPRV
jgi:hypothetical protein